MPSPSPLADPVVVGRFGSPHGVRGWIKVQSYTSPLETLASYKPWQVRENGSWFFVTTDGLRMERDLTLAHIAGINDRTEVGRLLSGKEICIPASALPKLPPGDYYWRDLLGMSVTNLQGESLGSVVELIETGANDVLVIEDQIPGQRPRRTLVPWLPGQVIVKVESSEGQILVDWDF